MSFTIAFPQPARGSEQIVLFWSSICLAYQDGNDHAYHIYSAYFTGIGPIDEIAGLRVDFPEIILSLGYLIAMQLFAHRNRPSHLLLLLLWSAYSILDRFLAQEFN